MSYLSRLDLVLRFKTYSDISIVRSMLHEIIGYENVSMEVEFCLIEFGLRLTYCDYMELTPFRVDYTKLLNFLDIGEELYSYMESIGIE